MNNKKMCPFKMLSQNFKIFNCSENFCAWYDTVNQKCSIVTISDVLSCSTINLIDWNAINKQQEK